MTDFFIDLAVVIIAVLAVLWVVETAAKVLYDEAGRVIAKHVDRALAGPLDDARETWNTSAVEVVDAAALPLSESPAAVRIRELIFANDVERWLAAREEEAS